MEFRTEQGKEYHAVTDPNPKATAPTSELTVTLAELQEQIAEDVAAGPSGDLIPTAFRAQVDLGVVEITPSYVSGVRIGTSWTACIYPSDNRPQYVKNNLFWSYSEDDAGRFSSPEEALAAAKRVS